MRARVETVRMEMTFSDRHLAQPLLEKLGAIPRLALTLVRGRVTPEVARLELRVTGSSRNVAEAMRLSQRWGITVRMLPPAMSLA